MILALAPSAHLATQIHLDRRGIPLRPTVVTSRTITVQDAFGTARSVHDPFQLPRSRSGRGGHPWHGLTESRSTTTGEGIALLGMGW